MPNFLKKIKYFNIAIPFKKSNNSSYFKMNDNIVDAINEDLKALLLTNNRERVMRPNYGIGLDNFLFENDLDSIKGELNSRILKQTSWIDGFTLKKIDIKTKNDYKNVDLEKYNEINENTINISIFWSLKNIPDDGNQKVEMELDLTTLYRG